MSNLHLVIMFHVVSADWCILRPGRLGLGKSPWNECPARTGADKEDNLGLAHIVRFLCFDVNNPRQIDIYLEYMSGGTLETVLRNRSQLSPIEVRNWSHQTCLGVDCLHRHHIMHRDLKPANIMLTDRELLKICDFGISQVYTESLPSTPFVIPHNICGMLSANWTGMHARLPIAHNNMPKSPWG